MIELLLQNKELIKIIYALAIIFICAFIVLKTDRLFQLSLHRGIRYLRNVFFFYGVGFFIRYILSPYLPNYFFIFSLSEFFLVTGGFFLLYSLLWKNFENPAEKSISSLFNLRTFIFYIMSTVIVLLDYFWQTYYFLFLSQILIFLIVAAISYSKYLQDKKRRNFMRKYSFAMLLSMSAWILNALASLWFSWNAFVIIIVYFLNIIIFLLFLYGVLKVTRQR